MRSILQRIYTIRSEYRRSDEELMMFIRKLRALAEFLIDWYELIIDADLGTREDIQDEIERILIHCKLQV